MPSNKVVQMKQVPHSPEECNALWEKAKPVSYSEKAKNIVALGNMLIENKEALPHGSFTKWIESNCLFKDWAAQRMMKQAKNVVTTDLDDEDVARQFCRDTWNPEPKTPVTDVDPPAPVDVDPTPEPLPNLPQFEDPVLPDDFVSSKREQRFWAGINETKSLVSECREVNLSPEQVVWASKGESQITKEECDQIIKFFSDLKKAIS